MTCKKFSKSQGFFQVLFSIIFYKKSGTFNETVLTLTCNIFLRKSWFLCTDKSQVQNSGDVIACFFFALSKNNKNLEAVRLIVGPPPPPLSSVIFL